MRKGGGHAKGAQWEREVCVILSKWLSSNTQDDIFWRSSLSGGRATTAFKKGKSFANQVGDISCIHPMGQHFIDTFAIENKFYAKLDYEGLLSGRGKLLAFWAEIDSQAKRYNKLPFLVCRQNRLHPHVGISKDGMRKLDLRDIETTLISIPYNLYILELEKFIKVCKPYVI